MRKKTVANMAIPVSAGFFFLLLFFTRGPLFAQDSIVPAKKQFRSLEISADASLNSNVINNDFIRAFYYGDSIDDIMKESVSEKMIRFNRLGGSSQIGFLYSVGTQKSPEDERSRSFSFGYYDRQHLDIRFTNDLFNTVFYGNKMFAGQQAVFGNSSLEYLHYEQIRLGWDWSGDLFHGSYGFAFSLLSGDQNTYIYAPIATLYTANDGTYLDLDVELHARQSDTAHTTYFSQNGIGFSTDFYYEMPYTFWKKSGRIRFEVKDLGAIRWNSNSMWHYTGPRQYHYEGIDAADLFNIDSTTTQVNVDEVIDENTEFSRKPYLTNIPCTFEVNTKSYYGKQVAVEKGVVWRFNSSAWTYYYAKLHFLFGRKKTADIAYIFGYGGYGKFNSGIEAGFDLGKKCSVRLISNYLFSGITAESSSGMGFYGKLTKRF